jgi:uncharacterized RDD family membrane protein YckC
MQPTPQEPGYHNPYAPPVSPISHYGNQPDKPLAGRGARLGASLLDGIVAVFAIIPIGMGAGQVNSETGATTSMGTVLMGIGALAFLGLLIYQLVLLAKQGQTLGKKWLGIRIVRNDGSPASFGRTFGLRMLLNGLIGFIPLYGLVDILFIFAEDRRCLHDKLADTKVVVA